MNGMVPSSVGARGEKDKSRKVGNWSRFLETKDRCSGNRVRPRTNRDSTQIGWSNEKIFKCLVSAEKNQIEIES